MFDRFYRLHYSPKAMLRRAKKAIDELHNVSTRERERAGDSYLISVDVVKHGHRFKFKMQASNQRNRIKIRFPMGLAIGRIEPNRVYPNGVRTCRVYVRRQQGHGYEMFSMEHVGSRLIWDQRQFHEIAESYLLDILAEFCREA